MEESTTQAMLVYLHSRGYLGGLTWTRIDPDNGRSSVGSPGHIGELESFIDVANTGLVLAECDGDKLCLLLWNMPTNRSANAARYVSTSLLVVWSYDDRTYHIASQKARAVSAAWLDHDMYGRFIDLVSNHIVDVEREDIEGAPEAGVEHEGVEDAPSYCVTESFMPTLGQIIEDALNHMAEKPLPSDLHSQVQQDSPEERERLAKDLRKTDLPRIPIQKGSCTPLVIVTRNKFAVQGVWQMLTALPHGSAPEQPEAAQHKYSGKLLRNLPGCRRAVVAASIACGTCGLVVCLVTDGIRRLRSSPRH